MVDARTRAKSLLPIHISCTILNICTEPIVRGDAYVIETESFLTVMSSAARAHGPTRQLLLPYSMVQAKWF